MLAEGGFLDSPYGNCTDKAWLLLSAPNYCRIILRTFCMHLAHPLPSDGWHLRGIMAFIIILSTLIDTLFDQRRYPLWIRVSRCQKCKIPLIRNASSVFIPFPPTLICPLSLFFASRLSSFFSPSPWHIWITYHFPDCAPKKVKHSLPFSFSYWCASQQPACSGWNGSWSKTAVNREGKLSKILFCSVHRLIWPCASDSKLWDTWHALQHQYFFRSCQTELYIFWQGIHALKVRLYNGSADS